MVDTPRPFRREVAVGRIIGDTASANGKIFAAFKSRPSGRRSSRAPIPSLRLTRSPTRRTWPTSWTAWGEGVAFDIEERNVGTCAVAAPVRDQLGR